MNPRQTVVYTRSNTRIEKLITLGEWVEFERLQVGQKILLGEVDPATGISKNRRTIFVGDCTPYTQPTTNDGGIGWSYDSDICKLYVLEVHEHGTT